MVPTRSPLIEVPRRRRRTMPPLYVLLAAFGIIVIAVSAAWELIGALLS